MTKRTLITISVVADALDMTGIGHFPPLGPLIDIVILCFHVAYIGKAGLATILEMVPFGGLLPIFTIAALCYGKGSPQQHSLPPALPDSAGQGRGDRTLSP